MTGMNNPAHITPSTNRAPADSADVPTRHAPSIYVACLAAYNNAKLHGAWIEICEHTDEDDVRAAIQEILDTSPEGDDAEEYAIHDFENFCGIGIDEYDSISEVVRLAQALNEHGEAYAAFCRDVVGTVEDATVEAFHDSYCGTHNSAEDYAYELLNDCHDIPEYLENYIDYEKFARDLDYSGDYTFVDGDEGTHVFNNHY